MGVPQPKAGSSMDTEHQDPEYDAYLRRRDELNQSVTEQQTELDRTLLKAGGIALFAALAPTSTFFTLGVHRWLLGGAWVCFVLCLVAVLWSLWFSIKASQREGLDCDSRWDRHTDGDASALFVDDCRSRGTKRRYRIVSMLNTGALISFNGGVVLTIAFFWVNYMGEY